MGDVPPESGDKSGGNTESTTKQPRSCLREFLESEKREGSGNTARYPAASGGFSFSGWSSGQPRKKNKRPRDKASAPGNRADNKVSSGSRPASDVCSLRVCWRNIDRPCRGAHPAEIKKGPPARPEGLSSEMHQNGASLDSGASAEAGASGSGSLRSSLRTTSARINHVVILVVAAFLPLPFDGAHVELTRLPSIRT
jgi:hypothetical protein